MIENSFLNSLTPAGWIGLTFAVSLATQIVFYIFAIIFRTDKVTDLSYSLGFITTASVITVLAGNFSPAVIFALAMIVLWGLRLGGYLFVRILKIKKDARFDNMRGSFVKFSLFWVLQSVTVGTVLTGFASAIAWSRDCPGVIAASSFDLMTLTLVSIPGILLFLAGLIIETVADIQKYRYRNDPANSGHWMDRGLWKRSRHPNFLGEIMVWFGIYFAILPWLIPDGQEGSTIAAPLIALISPMAISLLLRFVSGVPMLEKKADKRYADNAEYQEYKRASGLIFFKVGKGRIK